MNVFASAAAFIEHDAGAVCSVCHGRHLRGTTDFDRYVGCRCCPACGRIGERAVLRDLAADFPDLAARCATNRRGERVLTVAIFDEGLARLKAENERLEAKLSAEGKPESLPVLPGASTSNP